MFVNSKEVVFQWDIIFEIYYKQTNDFFLNLAISVCLPIANKYLSIVIVAVTAKLFTGHLHL